MLPINAIPVNHPFAFLSSAFCKMVLSAACLSLLFHLSAADCVLAPSGLAGWWPAESNATDWASTHNGILQGGATANAAGFAGSSFTFDGTNGYVQVPDSP